MKFRHSSTLGALVVAAALMVGTAGCSVAGSPSSGATPGEELSSYMVPEKDGAVKVGFSNSFAGNSWRAQMVEELKYAAETTHKDDVSSLTVTDANGDVSTQLSQINDLVSSGVDVLLIDAASDTALNKAIEQAHSRGVLVVSFDSVVTSENAIILDSSQEEFGAMGGEWLAGQLQSGDSVITLDGIAGNAASQQRHDGAVKALEAAGITVAGSADADWDQAKGQTAAANLLTAYPETKGIYSQGGAMSLGALNVLIQRNLPLIPVVGESNNGFLKKWKELKDASGYESIAPESPPTISVAALELALDAIRGNDPGHIVPFDRQIITQDTLEDFVRVDLSDSLWLPTNLPEATLQRLYGN